MRDGPLHWETVVAEFLETFETWLPLENFDNAEWIRQQWVEMFLKKCASEVREARKKGRRGNKRLATNLGERVGNKATGHLPELPNTTSMVVICRMRNGNNDQTSSNQFQASYPDVRHWEELIAFIETKCSLKEPYCLMAIYKCSLTQEELDEEYTQLYPHGQIMNDPLYGQISYNSSLSNAFKLKLGHDVKLFLGDMKPATGKDIAENVMKPAQVISASLVTVSHSPVLISLLRLRRYPKNMKEWWMRRQVRTRLIVLIM